MDELFQDGASVRTRKSASSSRSSVSAAAAKARAVAEAARARAAFAEKEKSIKVEKAKLEANLKALKYEREAAAANAQAEVLEAAADLEDEGVRSMKSSPMSLQNTHDRVSDYVQKQNACYSKGPESANLPEPSEQSFEPRFNLPSQFVYDGKEYFIKNSWHIPPKYEHGPGSPHAQQIGLGYNPSIQLNAQTQCRIDEESRRSLPKPGVDLPKYINASHTSGPEPSAFMDMAKYLARKELVSTGLSHFDDHPETYSAWKSSFSNTIKDLDLTASEQLDLLSKWLLTKTNWFTGPAFLYKSPTASDQQQTFELVDPDSDVDIRPQVTSCITSYNDEPLNPERFERFSSWKSLQRAVATLIHVAQSFKSTNKCPTGCSGWHQCKRPHTVDELNEATTVILRTVQMACFPEERKVLSKGTEVNTKSPLARLNPAISPEGLLRIGGRLKQADLSEQEKHPVILPGKHHVSTLLIRHYHEQVEHQGRTFTEGAVRAAGLWLIGG